ncbi:MAG: hypothetical protein WC058_02150 [Phycisphaeraceae bacterium]
MRISVGFEENWKPADFYAVFPRGFQGKDNEASAYIDVVRVGFGAFYQPDGRQMRSTNLLGYTLSQEGEYLVVGYLDRERWYFESLDGGVRWRLAKIGWLKHPGQFTDLEYTNDQITALRFPNGEKVNIIYDGTLPKRIETPWGETTLIDRDSGGLVKKITIYRQQADGGLGRPLKTFQYEYGADRKIKRYVNSFGTPVDVSCKEYETKLHDADVAVYETTIRNEVDGSFYFQRHISDKRGEWQFETRWGTAEDTPETAPLTSMERRKHAGSLWSVVAEARGSEKREVNYELDNTGQPKVAVDAAGKTRLLEYDSLGRPLRQVDANGKITQTAYNIYGERTRQTEPDGREQLWEYDEQSRLIRHMNAYGRVITYAYDDRGYCNQAIINGKAWHYEFDKWGRLGRMEAPNGHMTQWTFDRYGQLVEEARMQTASPPPEVREADSSSDTPAPVPLPGLPGAGVWTRYEYDIFGHLKTISCNDGRTERFEYNPKGWMLAHIRADGIRVQFAYDGLGRLREMRDPMKQVIEYLYHPSGAVRLCRVLAQGQPPVTERYNHIGELISKTVEGQGETQYVYDVTGKLVEKVGPDAKTNATTP